MADWKRLHNDWRKLGFRERPPEKSTHILVPSCRAIALDPALLRVVGRLVGAPMMLATMSMLVKPAGWEHRWHSDIENFVDPEQCPGGTSWTVWLPLRHADAHSTLHLVTHTHDVNRSAHDVIGRQCKICQQDPTRTLEQRGAALLSLTRSLAPSGGSSQYIRLAAHDGGAWLFKGRTWHAAANPTNRSRIAVQMHFMPAACKFRSQTPDGHRVFARRPLGVVPLPTPDARARNLCFTPVRSLRSTLEAATDQPSPAAAASTPHSAVVLRPPAVDVCVVVVPAETSRSNGQPPPTATDRMLRSLRSASSSPIRLHLLSPDAGAVRAGLDAMLEASADAWEAVQVVRVSDETMAAAAEAIAPGLAAGPGGAWAVAPLLLPRLLTVER
jgi:ectoine hydroxylase-related dioxygenase (phytanoyl-CoA dioxygenase family)